MYKSSLVLLLEQDESATLLREPSHEANLLLELGCCRAATRIIQRTIQY